MNYFQIAFDIVLTIIGLYLAFGKSYFSEKGKNLATREDVGLITKEIETVKNEIIFSVQRKNELLKERNNVGLAFNDDATFFVDYSSKVADILANNQSDLLIIRKQIEDIRFQGAKIISSFLKIFIYFEESAFTISAQNYYDSTVKIQQLTISLLFQLEQFALRESIMLESFKNGQSQYKEELFAITKNRKEIFINHMTERKKLLETEVYELRGVFITELSDIIRKHE